MKKLIYFSLSLLLVTTTIFTSCKKSSSTTINGPSIHLNTGTGYISGNQTVTNSTPILIGIIASAGDGNLTKFEALRTFNSKSKIVKDSTFSSKSFTYDINTFAQGSVGQETWVFTIHDSNGDSASVTFIITTTPPNAPGPINDYSSKTLGAQISSSGNAFASTNGIVYILADAKTNSALIDWVYYWDAIGEGTLSAPSDSAAALQYNNGSNGIQNWQVRNATKFKILTGAFTWSKIVNDSLITIENQSGVNLSKVNNLTVGNIIAFKTAAGKEGLILIDAITNDVTGTITFDVKVQQ
jgi:hypothetical protein